MIRSAKKMYTGIMPQVRDESAYDLAASLSPLFQACSDLK